MQVAYSCYFLAVSDSASRPDIGTSLPHSGIMELFEIGGLKMAPYSYNGGQNVSAPVLFKSMSDHLPWLKNSKNVIFQMRHIVPMFSDLLKGQS